MGTESVRISCLALVALFAIYPVLAVIPYVSGWAHNRRRRKLGLCLHCGYDLRGIPSGRCPECGTRVEGPRAARFDRPVKD